MGATWWDTTKNIDSSIAMFAFYSLAYIAGTFVILSPVIVLGCCAVKSDDKWKAERDREYNERMNRY
jgi:hypothetical protein